MTFDATHRCDRCGAQAYASALYAAEVLLFCVHHWRKSEAAIRATAETFHDESHLLYERETKRQTEGVS